MITIQIGKRVVIVAVLALVLSVTVVWSLAQVLFHQIGDWAAVGQ